MSTYIYLECLDHDPPIRADEESGQHLYDLPQLRDDVANRERLVRGWNDLDYPDLGQFRNHTLRFLSAHQKCRLRVCDEYGREHPLAMETK